MISKGEDNLHPFLLACSDIALAQYTVQINKLNYVFHKFHDSKIQVVLILHLFKLHETKKSPIPEAFFDTMDINCNS